jgi:DNA repair photolyase
MGLNKSKGNMYPHISHTWNPLGGKCPHACTYCSTNKLMRYPVIKEKYSGPPRLIEKELTTNLGKGNFIFVCAQNDLFAKGVSDDIIMRVLEHCKKYDNKYLYQTKNPERFHDFLHYMRRDAVLCTTIESNTDHFVNDESTPPPIERAAALSHITKEWFNPVHITIEPIMKFELPRLVRFLEISHPAQINIGADSGNNNLPEPSTSEIKELLSELSELDCEVVIKDNLKRLL